MEEEEEERADRLLVIPDGFLGGYYLGSYVAGLSRVKPHIPEVKVGGKQYNLYPDVTKAIRFTKKNAMKLQSKLLKAGHGFEIVEERDRV
jgi:hypothetical protein